MSKREKLLAKLLALPVSMRFDEVRQLLVSHGYKHHQPRGGSSHHIFRKPDRIPLSIPSGDGNVKRVYLKIVANTLVTTEEDKDE